MTVGDREGKGRWKGDKRIIKDKKTDDKDVPKRAGK